MKRKRGNKKGKAKGPPRPPPPAATATVNLVNLTGEENSGDEYDGSGNEADDFESKMEVDTPSSTGTDQPLNLASIKPDGSIDKAAGKSVGGVKVKLKTLKVEKPQCDADKGSLQMGSEQHGMVNDKMEDSGNSLPEVKMGISASVSKKPGSIKIKSSKVLGSLRAEPEKSGGGDAPVARDDSSQLKGIGTSRGVSLYNKQELDSALMVIQKIMKMDAAEPFNVPVNPEALGIPDYFDVIDTPMDFGTICSNLQKGDKYMNSDDVYKDVQFIWDNCCKYNSKGDYILDLLKRVKKNFMKNWMAAGLYTEQSGPNGVEGFQGEDAAASSQSYIKSGQLKHKAKKRHGRRHKVDCLCAICVLKRRRKEREENARLAQGQNEVTDDKLAQPFKQEGSSFMESSRGGDSSSNMGDSLDPEADVEVEGKVEDVKDDITERQYIHVDDKDNEDLEEEEEDDEESNDVEMNKDMAEKLMQSQYADAARVGEERNRLSRSGITEHEGSVAQPHTREGPVLVPNVEETLAVWKLKQKKLQERRAKMLENFRFENPMLLSLCGALFTDDRRSVWSGPHSLVRRQDNPHKSSIHAFIETLMK